MRMLMVLMVASAGLRAQQKVEEQKVEEVKAEELKKEAPKVCSIPLLVVKPSPKVDPKMAIVPKGPVRYQMREVIPPAPVCESVRWK